MLVHNSQLQDPKPSLPLHDTSKLSPICNHKIDLLLRKQNCHLPSIQCQHKCSHQHLKDQNNQHQYSTENQLRKFMTNKIQYKNKPIMIEKQSFKKQILQQIQKNEQLLKQLKDNLGKQIDQAFYDAVKHSNDETTAKGMDKFYKSQLEELTCHEVYSLFSFKPVIDEKISQKTFSGLKEILEKIVQMGKSLLNYKSSVENVVSNMFIKSKKPLDHLVMQADPQKDKKMSQNESSNVKKTDQVSNVEKMIPESEQKIILESEKKIILESEKKMILESEKKMILESEKKMIPESEKKMIPESEKKINEKPQQVLLAKNFIVPQKETINEKETLKEKSTSTIERQDNKASQQQIQKEPKPHQQKIQPSLKQSTSKPIHSNPLKASKSIDGVQSGISTDLNSNQGNKFTKPELIHKTYELPKQTRKDEDRFTPSYRAKISQSIQEKYQIIEKLKKLEQLSQNSQSQKQQIKPQISSLSSIQVRNPSELNISSEKPQVASSTQEFSELVKNYKGLGSLKKIDPNLVKSSSNEVPNFLKDSSPKPYSPNNFLASTKPQTNLQSASKNNASEFKRKADALTQKWITQGQLQGRKIIKTSNESSYPIPKDDTKAKQIPAEKPLYDVKAPNKNLSNQTKMPESTENKEKSNEKQKTIEKEKPIEKQKLNEKETSNEKEKPIVQHEQTKKQPIVNGAAKIMLDLIRQSSQSQNEELKQPSKPNQTCQIVHEPSIQEKQTPKFKAASSFEQQFMDKLSIDKTIKQLEKLNKVQDATLVPTKKPEEKQKPQTSRSFLQKPTEKMALQQQMKPEFPGVSSAAQKPVVPSQVFEDKNKTMRVLTPSRPKGLSSFGRNPTFNPMELFEKAQNASQKKEEKKLEYQRNSLQGEVEKQLKRTFNENYHQSQTMQSEGLTLDSYESKTQMSSTKFQESSKPIELQNHKSSQIKINLKPSFYYSQNHGWFNERK